MKILILGGTGFIGSNIIPLLKSEGHFVGVYSKCDSAFSLGDCQHLGDLLTDYSFPSIVRGYDAIIYLVSAVTPAVSMQEVTSPYVKDVPMLLRTLEECRYAGIRRIVFASSGGTIYGDSQEPNREDTDVFPVNNYAIMKLASEKILLMYNMLYGFENIVLRISNPFGHGQKSSSGVGAIATFLEKALSREPIILFGNGTNIRDYISVKYVADAFIKAIDWSFNRELSPVYNIGSGHGLSLLEVIDIISSVSGIEPIVHTEPARNFDISCNILDVAKARKWLGYNPPRDSTTEIVRYVREVVSEKKETVKNEC